MKALNINPGYRDFIHSRDRALEQLLKKNSQRMSNALSHALGQIDQLLISTAHSIQGHFFDMKGFTHERIFENQVQKSFGEIYVYLVTSIEDMLRRSYILAYVGELEGVGRALGRPEKFDHPSPEELRLVSSPVAHRVEYVLFKLKNEILTSFKRARIQEQPVLDFIATVRRSFPRTAPISNRYVLKKPELRESGLVKGVNYSFGALNEDEWDTIVDEVREEFVPDWRKPEAAPDKYFIPGTNEEKYLWELEQEATDGFVNQVRDGQVDAANQNGINDFVWIAILDDRTDLCCEKRDGLTTSEIEEKLKSTWSADECKAKVPPAHFNCRCTLAPMSDDVNEVAPPNASDFDEWLIS